MTELAVTYELTDTEREAIENLMPVYINHVTIDITPDGLAKLILAEQKKIFADEDKKTLKKDYMFVAIMSRSALEALYSAVHKALELKKPTETAH